MFPIPADYIAIRDNCIQNKEKKTGKPASEKQMQECKKLAAILYFKKHGKPVNDSTGNYFDISDFENDELQNNSILSMVDDNILEIYHENEKIIAKLNLEIAEDSVNFTQPFDKKEVNYRESDLLKPSDTTSYDNAEFCGGCVHFVPANTNMIGNSPTEIHMCHLVRGFIDDWYVCDKHAEKLLESEDTEDVQVARVYMRKNKDKQSDKKGLKPNEKN